MSVVPGILPKVHGASNYLCLTDDPIYNKYKSSVQTKRSRIYGAEYQTEDADGIILPSNLFQRDVPCAVCHVSGRASQIMIPGRNVCPAGWRTEYKGYLMPESYIHYRTMYTCVDENAESTIKSVANKNGKFLNLDSLKCHFLDFGERFYRILMVRKRHCNISEALANVLLYRLRLGAPIWHIEVGIPRVLQV